MGDALWRTLDADQAFTAARQAAGTRILPLTLESADPLVQSLPWECLHHPEHGFLGKHPGFSLTRRLSAAPSVSAEPPKGPLKVLLFTALPDDLDQEKERLDMESEQANMLEALDPLIHQGWIQLTTPDDGRFDRFQKLLREQEFHLAFLSGHGQFNADPLLGPTGAWFWFEGADGRSDPVEGKELAQAFSGTAVRAVVLSACQSGKSTSTDLGSSLAMRLLQTGLPHVVGMRESILDLAGIHFAHALCEALGRQERLDVALQAARGAIAESPALAGPRKDVSGATERSWGQWCLPLLYSRNPAQPLIDWQFQPQPPQPPLERYHEIAGMALPAAFIGRRRECGNWGNSCMATDRGNVCSPARAVRAKPVWQGVWRNGWKRVVGWCGLTRRGGRALGAISSTSCCSAWRSRGRNRWIAPCCVAGRRPTRRGCCCGRCCSRPATSWRWCSTIWKPCKTRPRGESPTMRWPLGWMPASRVPTPRRWCWSRRAGRFPVGRETGGVQRPLGTPLYGDFLRYHQHLGGAPWGAERLRRLYEALGGNFKGLEFFHALSQVTGDDEAFLRQLEQSKKELQLYMAVKELVGYLQPAERELLNRLRAYLAPTFADGVRIIAQDLAEPERLLRRLVGLSLVEVEIEPELCLPRYRLSLVVADWLQQHEPEPASDVRQRAAQYQHWVFDNLRRNQDQALIAHEALRQSGLDEDAARFALDVIVPHFNRMGLYHKLLKDWLPALRESRDQKLQADALHESGTQYVYLSQYDEALPFLEESLAISREIGDRQGESITLNNLAQIFKGRGDHATALEYLHQSLAISLEIGDQAGKGITLNNIAQIFKARSDHGTALEYLRQSLAISRAIGDRRTEGGTLNNIARIYDARGDHATALEYLHQSLAISLEIGDQAGKVQSSTISRESMMPEATTPPRWSICTSRWPSAEPSATRGWKATRSIISR